MRPLLKWDSALDDEIIARFTALRDKMITNNKINIAQERFRNMKIIKALVSFIELWAEYGDEIIDLHNKLVAAIKDRRQKEDKNNDAAN